VSGAAVFALRIAPVKPGVAGAVLPAT